MGGRLSQAVVETVETRSPNARVSQFVIETVELRAPIPKVSQYVIEYVKGPRLPTEYSGEASDTILVTPDITFEIENGGPSNVELTVEHFVAVGQHITAPRNVELDVSDSVGVESEGIPPLTVNLTVTSSVNVAPESTPYNSTRRLTVGHSVQVQPLIFFRNTVVRKTVINSVTVTPLGRVVGRDVFLTVSNSVHVDDSIAARNTVIRLTVESEITADNDDGDVGNTQNRQTIIQPVTADSAQNVTLDRFLFPETVHIDAVAIAHNPSPRFTFFHSIGIQQSVVAQSTRQTISHGIVVSQQLTDRPSPNRQKVSHAVAVAGNPTLALLRLNMLVETVVDVPQFWSVAWPATGRSDVQRQTVTHKGTVSGVVAGGPSLRNVTHNEIIFIDQLVRSSFVRMLATSEITVSDFIGNGGGRQEHLIADAITVTDVAAGRKDPIKQTVSDLVILKSTNIPTAQQLHAKVKITQTDPIRVYSIITERVVSRQIVGDRLEIKTNARSAEPKLKVAHGIAITDKTRQTPVYMQLGDSISIDLRPRDQYLIVHSNIQVGTKVWRQHDAALTEQLVFSENLKSPAKRTRALTEQLPLEETLTRQVIWTQNLSQFLEFPDVSFRKGYTFLPYPLDIPVMHGGLMSNLVVLESGNNAITLPAALLGDSQSNVDKITVQRSMNAKTLTIISTSDRQKFVMKFRLSLLKSYELREFFLANKSKQVKLTTWTGAIWVGYFVDDDFKHTHTGASTTEQEFVNLEITFEGAKVGG